MEFEFDEAKSRANSLKHGIDFVQAQELWDDPAYTIITARSSVEDRFVIIARREEESWSAIYTLRGEAIRIISVRRSRQNEKEIYRG
jgi:uncharacterized DUF497 family protein